MDYWMGALGVVFVLAGVLQVFFADEIGVFFRRRRADDFFTNADVWRYVGYATVVVGAATIAIAYY